MDIRLPVVLIICFILFKLWLPMVMVVLFSNISNLFADNKLIFNFVFPFSFIFSFIIHQFSSYFWFLLNLKVPEVKANFW
jgi:hypothetical protein